MIEFMKRIGRAWFGLRAPVTRAEYLAGGVLFMALKFAIERALFQAWAHKEFSLGAFLSPFFVRRVELLSDSPDGMTGAMIGIAMPFLWIGISMSVRRALDAGLPPLVGFLFLIPGVHYILIAILCVLPSKPLAAPLPKQSAYRPAPAQETLPKEPPSTALIVIRAVTTSSAIGFLMFAICVYVFKSYGTALFLATPFVMGFVAAMSYRAAKAHSPGYQAPSAAVGCGFLGLVITGIGLFFMAQEGLACLAMAILPAGVLSLLGSLMAISVFSFAEVAARRSGAALVMLPLAAGAESMALRPPLYEVVTSVEVDAPPEVVFRHVTSFPDLDPPHEWIFQKGISYPVRAKIEGQGVGAIRYCEFSTGSFVEPITRWDAPHVLSFDVAENPPPMREWSLWDNIDAPHLHGFMRSKRGEFRLTKLPSGKTRLEGSTFYELQIYPAVYWKVWTDSIVHTIHGRVLRHIQKLAEADARLPR